ncbi:hypothetical protein B0H10DRAFT_1988920 [Mycena sp. CBHHK59/15]|nr:hypothetical protein B0H10DRAFT_1988920 [Mycena sp. CBHHK59/15]
MAHWQGDEETALNIFLTVLDGSTEMDVHRRRADCMTRIGDIQMRHGHLEEARKLWEDARPLFARSSQMKEVAGINARLEGLPGLSGKLCQAAPLKYIAMESITRSTC